MKHANNIQHKDAYVGMEFLYTHIGYKNGKSYTEERAARVDSIRTTKKGRIHLTVDGEPWGNLPSAPTSPLQAA